MLTLDVQTLGNAKVAGYLQAAIAPRPICFASTIDAEGKVNLSPFSFYNVFSTNPATLIFSPSISGRTGGKKHTLLNMEQVPEVCINVVTYDIVQQMSLASSEYARGINEFEKAGFTELASTQIRPPRVSQSPVQMECTVREIISLGKEGGAGQLALCEVLVVHIDERILDENNRIDPMQLDLVARMGGNWYTRALPGFFEVEKPLQTLGLGVDLLPQNARLSEVLTGNDLGRLGNVETHPDTEMLQRILSEEVYMNAAKEGISGLHHLAKRFLEQDHVDQALAVVLLAGREL